MAVFVVVALLLATIGYGAAMLRLVRLQRVLSRGEAVTIGFALGTGIIGWLLFPIGIAGWFQVLPLTLLIAAGCIGLAVLPGFDKSEHSNSTALSRVETAIVAVLCIAVLFDLTEGLTPPADADSLTYHFAIPKMFIASGRLDFVPVAVDGAIPLLVQLTYLPPLALGGERAMTLWTFTSGWFAVALAYVVARRLLDRTWALAVALVFAMTPAVVYGAGSGQVEMRNVLFAVAAAQAIAFANKDGYRHADLALMVVAGLCAGFCAGGKYFGLAFVAAAGLVVLFGRRWLVRGAVFGVSAVLAGFQWYLWNTIHTGDPVFPALFEIFGRSQPGVWTDESQVAFRSVFQSEIGVSTSLFWLLVFPFKATLDGLPIFESGRTGFGPFLLLIAPLALAGFWSHRRSFRSSEVTVYLAIAGLFYILWFFSGVSQRIRHLLPVLPLVLIGGAVAAERWATHRRARPALALAFLLTAAVQLAGHALFALGAVQHVVSDESRDEYYARTVPFYEPIAWINENLGKDSKVITEFRWYNYLVDIPIFLAQPYKQAGIYLLSDNRDASRFAREIKDLDITHIVALAGPDLERDPDPSALSVLSARLAAAGCLESVQSFRSRRFSSRTLRSVSAETPITIFRVVDRPCPAVP